MNALINTFNTLCKNTSILFFAFLLFFFAHSPLKAATLFFNNGFESGNLTGYKPHLAGGKFTVATSPVGSGKYSGKFSLTWSSTSSNYRAETYLDPDSKGIFYFGKEYWLSFKYRFEDWAKDRSADFAPFQVHARPGSWNDACYMGAAYSVAPFFMMTQNDETRFVTYGGKIMWRATIQKQKWQTITVHFRPSKSSTGFIEAWKDGVKIGRVDGANQPNLDGCGLPVRDPYWHMGVYKWDWKLGRPATDSRQRLLFVDALKIAEGTSGYSMVTSASSDPTSGDTISNPDDAAPISAVGEELVAHWPMKTGTGTTTPDASGNGYTATLANGAQLTADGSVQFDGVDDYVNAGNPSLSGKAMTASAWIWSDDLDNCPKRGCNILSKATGSTKQSQDLTISTVKKGSKTRLRFRLNIDGATSNLTAATGDVQKGEWIHVAAVYDGKKMRLYQDGVRVGSKAQKGSITLRNPSPIWIGGNSSDAASQPWFGKISDVRLYNYALTPEEIADLAK